MSTAQSLLIGGRYRLLHPLGEGGMGRVWLARDEVLHRDVAIKELVAPPGLTRAERAEMRARSRREARAVARLNHPNVVRVFDVVETGDGDPWIVMEYLRGQSLQEAMAGGPLPVQRVARMGLEILEALRAAHEAGIVHRDVKPGNILLSIDGRALLTDFGLATMPGDPYVTQTGLILGSPAYLAPERARRGTTSTAADLWSLGATLYAAIEGQPPFARPSTMETLAALAAESVPPPRRSGPLTSVLVGLLEKDPARRLDAATAQRLLREAAAEPDEPLATPDRTKPLPTVPLPPPPSAVPSPPGGAGSLPHRAPAAPSPTGGPGSLPHRAPAAPSPRPAPGRPKRSRRGRLLLPLAVLAAIAAVSLGLIDRSTSDSQNPPPVVTAPTSPAISPTTAAPPPSSAPPPVQSASPNGFQLPAGWQMRDDGTGFRVPVPDGWRFGRDRDGRAMWQDPATKRLLLIDQTRDPKPDPLQDWRSNEAARRDGYRDYQRIRLERVTYWDSAADWEFTYTLDATPVHVLNRGFITAPDQAYSIYWRTPAATWDENLDDLHIVLDGFVPARQ